MSMTNSESKKKGWLDGIKDWAFVSETEKAPENTNSNIKSLSTGINTSPIPVSATPGITPQVNMGVTSSVTMINPEKEIKAMEYFMKLLDKANLPGPDFFEFYGALRKAIQKKGNIINSEIEKEIYVNTFDALNTVGLESNVLFSSCEQYVALLKEHFDKFSEENKKVITEAVGVRQKKIENLNTSILQKTEQIKRLQGEILAHNTDITAIQTEIHSETGNIEETRVAMESAFNKIHTEFSQVGNKCKSYIPQL